MDTTAVPVSDIISKKHLIKWKDYHLLKAIIRNAYKSEDLSYQEPINAARLSMFKSRTVLSTHIFITVYFSQIKGEYTVNCCIR